MKKRITVAALALFIAQIVHSQSTWTNICDGPANTAYSASAIAVNKDGEVFITGISYNFPFSTVAYSNSGVPLWTNNYSGGSGRTVAIAADTSGNAIVTGWEDNNHARVIIAYSSAGAPLWTNRYNQSYGVAIAPDNSGNVIVTGPRYVSLSRSDTYVTTKYSGTGVLLWANLYTGKNNINEPYAIASDTSGNVYVTGNSSNNTTNQYDHDYATVAYSGAGVPLWTNRYDGTGHDFDRAMAIAADSNSNIFVTGYSFGTGSSYDYATIKYSSAGVPLWTNRYNGIANFDDEANSIAVDRNGNVIVSGVSATNNVSPYYYDYTTIKYSAAGVPLWTNRFDGPRQYPDEVPSIAVDLSGNVFVSGSSVGNNRYNFTTIKYSGAGVPIWTNVYSGPMSAGDIVRAMAMDGNGDIFVTGSTQPTNGHYSALTIKYATAAATPTLIISTNGGFGFTNGLFGFNISGAPGSNIVIQSSADLQTWSSQMTNPLTGGLRYFSDPQSSTNKKRFYRTLLLP